MTASRDIAKPLFLNLNPLLLPLIKVVMNDPDLPGIMFIFLLSYYPMLFTSKRFELGELNIDDLFSNRKFDINNEDGQM